MFNPNSKVTLSLSPKRKRSRANEPLDVGSPTAIGFKLNSYNVLNLNIYLF